MKFWLVLAMLALVVCASFSTAGSGSNSVSPGIWMALILPVSMWYLLEGQKAARVWFVAVVLIATVAAASAAPGITTVAGLTADEDLNRQISEQSQLKKFSSYEELKNFVTMNLQVAGWQRATAPMLPAAGAQGVRVSRPAFDLETLSFTTSITNAGHIGEYYALDDSSKDYVTYRIPTDYLTTDAQVDYSTTNIQVEGVDEADIVKSDGKYIYVTSGNKVVIIDAYPAENARILSEIEVNGNPVEIFINGNKLVVCGGTFVKVYDISNRENPLLGRDVSFDGSYFNSRMIGDFVYVIVNSPVNYRASASTPQRYQESVGYYVVTVNVLNSYKLDVSDTYGEIDLPEISSNGNVKAIPATEIYYFDNIDYPYRFTTIMSINTQNDNEEIISETFLMGAAQNIFVSSNNVYITYTNNRYPVYRSNGNGDWGNGKTIIHKISIADGTIEYKSWGEVPGRVLNQFSMDEYQGYFRIATTTGEVWGGGARNHVYVLDEDLNIVGRLEGIAPGERIYSARFMGGRAYLVTFKKIDPLFVIDLRDPRDPKVLGELEIPGYSDYLHPYDETHLIGVGKDTVESEWGTFAWYQGVKIALFDVSDPQNPREISKYVIGERGTDSYALQDHRAFLFSKSKNLLVIPISLVEDWGSPWWYGGYDWQGAYVFSVSLDDGFVLRGGITHSDYSVKRSLYIDNVLYTISDGLVKMNNLEDLNEINKIELQ